MHARRFSALLALLPALPAIGAGLSPDDLVGLHRLQEVSASVEGTRLAYTLRETDRGADRGRTDIWLLDLRGENSPKRLTTHAENDGSPRWGPNDEWLYFLSARSGSEQVWRLPMQGGDPMPVTRLPLDVRGFRLAPDGKTLVFSVAVYPDCGADFDCSAERDSTVEERKASGRRYARLFIRHWDSWMQGKKNGLFAQALDEAGQLTGMPVYLSGGLDANVPSLPFGGMEEVAISPDSRRVVFAARVADRSEPWSTNFDLYETSLSGGRRRNLTEDNPAWDTAPVFTPDGSSLIWLAMTRPGFEADRRRVLERNNRSGKIREIAAGWDLSPVSIELGAGGDKIYAIADDTGRRRLFEITRRDGKVTALTSIGWITAMSIATGGPVVVMDSLHQPGDLYRIVDATGALERLTSVNSEKLRGIQFGSYEQFDFAGWNEETVYGFVMQPAVAESGGPHPVAFLIHGGPQGSFGDHFHYRWNPQTYAAQGYAVVFIDFHGSTGYGQAFTDSISGDWGGKPLVDLRKGLDAALAANQWLDGERVCALGASYGGYMVNWIAGNWPQRFRCLVNHDGIFDNRMMYYTTEELWFPEWEHGGPYWSVPEMHEQHNPVNFVSNWQTPMLVIHGALDYRVPETQGIATFTALQRRGIDSEFLYFDDENHWVLKPANSVQWHETVHDWLARYLK